MDNNEREILEDRSSPFIYWLNQTVLLNVKCLAVFMVLVIIWGSVGVVGYMYQVMSTQSFLFSPDIMLDIMGSFLSILIAIEIFMNIVFYLKEDAIHVPLVLATALTAVARKVIVIHYNAESYLQLFATAAVVLAVGVTYWLVVKKN